MAEAQNGAGLSLVHLKGARLRPELTRSDSDILFQFRKLYKASDVADLLEIDTAYLKRVLGTRQLRASYTRFTIPKKAGGVRIIESPPSALRILQEKLLHILGLIFSPKPAVQAYTARRSILTNARVHAARPWILNVDLKDFFPSIHFGRVRGALMAKPFSLPRYAATAIAQLCTTQDGRLPQGASTSPLISNIVCARLDGQMMALAKGFGLIYSRYCDDITLSTRRPYFPREIASADAGWVGTGVTIGGSLTKVIESNGFIINIQKTRLQIPSAHQEVTGLTVNAFPNVPRIYIRSLRMMLHVWRRHGLPSASQGFFRRFARPPFPAAPAMEAHFRSVLRGRIEYVGYVRGRTDPVYCRLRHDLHSLDPQLIGSPPAPAPYRVLPSVTPGDRWSSLYAKLYTSIALLEVHRPSGDKSMGSAFAIDPNHWMTAAHNLVGAVTLHADNAASAITSCLLPPGGTASIDAALLLHAHGLKPLQFDRRLPDTGEPIAVLGFASIPQRQPALGLHVGHVEAITTSYTGQRLIQISCASSGGLSGSPLLDSKGRVVGVVIESTFEKTLSDVPGREFCTVLPIATALTIFQSSTPSVVPVP